MRGVVVAAACALLLAACGSSDKRLSRVEYAQRADAACRRYNQQVDALGNPRQQSKNLADFADRTLPILDRAIERLSALVPPRAEAVLARHWLTSLHRLHVDVVKIRDAVRANDLARVRALATAAQRDNDTTNRLARQLGLAICSSS
jgi:hypothetical protein